MIKVITGIRRCGKSYLLFNLFREYLIASGVSENNIICIPLDDIDYEVYCDPYKLHAYIMERIVDCRLQYYVFIDEAQYAITQEEMNNADVPIRLYGVLNSLLRKGNVDVYITGSNSKFLSSDILTEFRGRGDEIHMSPLAFSEYFPASGQDKFDAWKDYLYYGGLPHNSFKKIIVVGNLSPLWHNEEGITIMSKDFSVVARRGRLRKIV